MVKTFDSVLNVNRLFVPIQYLQHNMFLGMNSFCVWRSANQNSERNLTIHWHFLFL